MADRRRHRGPHPADAELFADSRHRVLQQAVADLSWLFGRGYVLPSALKLVGDRYQLTERQRTAVMRAACSEAARQQRARRRVSAAALRQARVDIDGFNLLTTIEAALSGGVLLRCRDGAMRDMASMHGTYRTVEETEPALRLIGKALQRLQSGPVCWWLDRPVSNAGRLATQIRELAEQEGWPWSAELHRNPDQQLMELTDSVIVSADRVVIEGSSAWYPLANLIVDEDIREAWIIELRDIA